MTSPISLSDLITPVTGDEQLESFLTSLEALKIPARSWRKAGAFRTILRVVASAYAGFSNVAVAFVKSGFLETNAGDWLTLYARSERDVERISATFATGKATIANGGVGIYGPFAPFELRLLNSTTHKAYTNIADVTLNPGDSFDIDIRAVELGSASNAAPTAIDELETPLPGVTVSNAAAVVGTDDEDDDDLKDRCKSKLGTLSQMGPRSAYAYAVASATRPDGSAVDINRRRISPYSSTGIVTIDVASASGAPATEDLDAVRASVELVARPDTVTVLVRAANPVSYARALTVWARQQDGLSASDLAETVVAALVDMAAKYPIGGIPKPPANQGYLFATNIEGIARAAHPAIYAVDGAGADIAMAAGDVISIAVTVDVRFAQVST